MPEYIDKIKIAMPDGTDRKLRMGGNEPVVEYLGGKGDELDRWIKEIYIEGSTSPFCGAMTFEIIGSIVTLILEDGTGYSSPMSENGIWKLKTASSILYMYIVRYEKSTRGGIRIINPDRCTIRAASPIISTILATEQLIETSITTTLNTSV